MITAYARKLTQWAVTTSKGLHTRVFGSDILSPSADACIAGRPVDTDDWPVTWRAVMGRIVEFEGRFVRVENGATFELEEPCGEYIEQLSEQGYAYDEEHPLSRVRR